MEIYKDQLVNRLDPSMSLMQGVNAKIRKNPKRVIFAEGEDINMLKAAIEFGKNKLGKPILIGAVTKLPFCIHDSMRTLCARKIWQLKGQIGLCSFNCPKSCIVSRIGCAWSMRVKGQIHNCPFSMPNNKDKII